MSDSNFQEKRSYERLERPIFVTINNTDYVASDWSVGGFKIHHFEDGFEVGDTLPIHLSWNFQGGVQISLDVLTEIVWRSNKQKATGFRFLNLRETEKLLIQQVASEVQTGKLPLEEETLDRENVANKQVLKGNIPEKTSKGGRFWLTTVGLSLLGVALLSGTVFALYRTIAFISISSARIGRSYKEVISTHRGKLSNLYVTEGMEVEAGAPLFRVYDEQMGQFIAEDQARNIQQRIRDKTENVNRLQEKLEVTRTELQEAKENLRIARSQKQEEIQKLQRSKQITQKQLEQAQARVDSLETQYQTAKKSLQRAQFLNREGAFADQRVDDAKAKLADIEGQLQQARKEVTIKEDMLDSMEQGSFYTGKRFNGNLPELKSKVEQASEVIEQKSGEITVYQRKIEQQQQKIQKLEQQYREQNFQLPQPNLSDPSQENIFSQVYQSPVDATIAKVKSNVGQSIQMGQTLLILEPEPKQITIDAFLTQDQATRISVSSNVKVTVPDSDLSYRATVTKIDRSGGLWDEVRGRYQFEGSRSRPVYVKLAIIDTSQQDKRVLTPGRPVELTIKKEGYF